MTDPTNANPSPNASAVVSDTPPAPAPSAPTTNTDVAMTDADSHLPVPEPPLVPEPTIDGADRDSASNTLPSTRPANIRQYLNEKVCPSLTAGCKLLFQDPDHLPEDPLRILGEYLLERHAEIVAQRTKEVQDTPKVDRPNGETASV
ncbi:hypothetical protein SAPIO_CDS3243 [Scedosporium apiospermum]|uniref:Dpy-30 domain-containing protein n=1 Tax=Pseudallescheria apiosperma TaxID=563466 RepID=A0A084GAC6_PSEDA|nr:uncharacterized protein SAPIO_CDS3243 [Scedosporium apiospermum]KEZ44288.1 hypothetical protein SAPIO_CDS3243 [Scedosporium apiospermum]